MEENAKQQSNVDVESKPKEQNNISVESKPKKKQSKLITKVITGFVIFFVLVGLLALRQVFEWTFDIAILLISVIAAYEIVKATMGEANQLRRTRFIFGVGFAIVNFAVFFALTLLDWTPGLIFLTQLVALVLEFVIFILLGAIIITMQKTEEKDLKEFGKTLLKLLFAFFYPTMVIGCFYYLNHIATYVPGIDNAVSSITKNGAVSFGLFGLVVAIFVATTTDTFAMLGGMLLKGPKLCPKISPNKTISGSLVGLLCGSVAAIIAFFIFNLIEPFKTVFVSFGVEWWHIFLIGFVASIMTQIGDLFESYIKRKVKIKDMSNIIRGHGGMLDRVDGLIFASLAVLGGLLIVML
jgi:CDP-diglyceride synthetase